MVGIWLCCRTPHESGDVAALRDNDLNFIGSAAGLIVFRKTFPEPVYLDTNNGILLLIKIRRPPERIDCDVVFLNTVRGAFKILGTDVRQDLRQTRRPFENP